MRRIRSLSGPVSATSAQHVARIRSTPRTRTESNSGSADMSNRADRKAHLAAARSSARRYPLPMLLDEPPNMPGWQFWKVGGVVVCMPKLVPGAPASLKRHYLQRVIANATGECPRCDTVATDPAVGAQASLPHDGDCPVHRLGLSHSSCRFLR